MHTVKFKKNSSALSCKFNVKKGNLAAEYSIALFDDRNYEMLFYSNGSNASNVDTVMTLPHSTNELNQCILRCITDFKRKEPIDKRYSISLEIYQGDEKIGELEQDGDLCYMERCLIFFGKFEETD